MEHWLNDNDTERPKYMKTCPSATLCTINPKHTELGLSSGLRGDRPATNRLTEGTTPTECSNTYVNKLGNICLASDL
jgi:hypothetical protein